MANAKYNLPVTKTELVIVEDESFTLTLTQDEVDTLMAVFYRIGGDQVSSPRREIKSVAEALLSAGAEYPNDYDSKPRNGALEIMRLMHCTDIGIYFGNYSSLDGEDV